MRVEDQSVLTSSPPGNLARTAWLVVALLLPVALLNYSTGRCSHNEVLDGRRHSEHCEQSGLGLVLGFSSDYAVLSPFGGYIADASAEGMSSA